MIEMKANIKYIFFIFFLSASTIHAQEQSDVILKAMQDELNRNMNDLKLPNYDKPFFIMYGIQDQKTYSVTATLGSIVKSSEKAFRFKTNTRVLVGDYEFNDESLEDNLTSAPTALEISLPIDNDYLGIRRSLWSGTDKIYRDAARHFQKHQQTLKETGKPLSEIPHRSFAKGTSVKLVSALGPYTFDKAAWEARAKNLSALFLKHPNILYSTVMIQFTEGHKYMVNSEGVIAKIPFRETSFITIGQHKNEQGEFVVDQVSHNTRTPDQLPPESQMKSEIETMIARIEKQLSVPKLDEEYNGPVLVTGDIVAHLFSSVLFNGNESILASNFIPRLTGYQYNSGGVLMDNKIGKSILSEYLTIKAKPKLNSYSGKDLLASFELDDEGITPPNELVVVENGLLKNLLNDRTITNTTQKVSGFSSGAGVIEITTTHKNSEKELKEKLIAKAKSEGLDFALILKHAPTLMGTVNVYKVYVKDGKEELVRNAVLERVNLKTFKRIMGASSTYLACNLGRSNFRNGNDSNQKSSYIVPEAILLESMEIKPFEMPMLKEEEYISNPLLEIK
jgi:hypothetical protein